jgi:hypothetical protein
MSQMRILLHFASRGALDAPPSHKAMAGQVGTLPLRIIRSGLGMLFFCARFCGDEPRKAGAEFCCAVDNDVVLGETTCL